jgi:hypothetical protein
MRRGLIATAVTVLVLAGPASAELPKAGALVPGRSLGGIRLGESPRAVRHAFGTFYGACRSCERRTWYFTYHAFAKQGLAVEFARNRVSGLYTLWQPTGWHSRHKLGFGSTPLTVHALAGATQTVVCRGYEALVQDTAHARPVYYLYNGRLWGFGLFRRGVDPCR